MFLSVQRGIVLLTEFVLSQECQRDDLQLSMLMFFSEATGEECIADEKQDPVSPAE